MGRRTVLIFLLSLFGAFGGSSRADSPTGTWKIRMSFGDRGTRTVILKLHQESGTLSGVLLDDPGSEKEIEKLRYEDGNLSFDISREWNGQRFTSHYNGKYADDSIQGTADIQWRSWSRSVEWTATRTTAEELSTQIEVPPIEADIPLDEANYPAWRDHILPAASELAWGEIPWLTTFKDGVLAADSQQKPLLLWTMNGHPLGCT